jgi:uncharacterized membrane protein YccC
MLAFPLLSLAFPFPFSACFYFILGLLLGCPVME